MSVVGFYKKCTYLLQGLRRPEIHLTEATEMTSHETSTLAGAALGWMVTGDQGTEALCSIPPLSLQLLLSIQIVSQKDRCMQSTFTESKLEQLSEMQSHLVGLHKMHAVFL